MPHQWTETQCLSRTLSTPGKNGAINAGLGRSQNARFGMVQRAPLSGTRQELYSSF